MTWITCPQCKKEFTKDGFMEEEKVCLMCFMNYEYRKGRLQVRTHI